MSERNSRINIKLSQLTHGGGYLGPFQSLLDDVLLLLPEGPVDDQLLDLLVAEVDDQLFEPVLLEGLEAVDVEDAEDLVLPVGFHLEHKDLIKQLFFSYYVYFKFVLDIFALKVF